MRIPLKAGEIIDFVRDIRNHWGNDPISIAEICGIKVFASEAGTPSGSTICMAGYPTIINLQGCISETAKRVLCAHELGHALLHQDMTINRFNGTSKGIQEECEYEANLFAVALLFNEDDFNRPLEDLNNWMLKTILDFNIQ